MLFTPIAALALFVSAVAAQNSTSNITIDPSSVDANTKAAWCNGEISACSTLCNGNAPTNVCDPTKLTYSCLCTNGSSPDLKDYKNTLPDYICQQAFAQCIAAHPNDLSGQTACKTDIQSQCGFLDLANYTSAATTTQASSTSSAASSTSAPASSTGSGSGTATAASASATTSSPALALEVGQSYGLGVFAAAAIAAFGYLL